MPLGFLTHQPRVTGAPAGGQLINLAGTQHSGISKRPALKLRAHRHAARAKASVHRKRQLARQIDRDREMRHLEASSFRI